MSETPSANWKTCAVRGSWTKFKTAETLIVMNNHNNVLMRLCKKGSKEAWPAKKAQHRTGGRRWASCVCVCVCVQLLTVSSYRPSVHRPPGKLGGGRSVTPRNALLRGARRSNARHSAAPLWVHAAISHGGRIIVDVPHATFQCKVVPFFSTTQWGVQEWRQRSTHIQGRP